MPVEKIILDIQAKVGKAKQDIDSLKHKTTGLNKEVDKTSALLKKAGTAMLAFASIGMITKAIRDMIKLNMEFEKTLTNVLTLLDATTKAKFKGFLETGALRTMRQYGLEVADVNKALFDTISAGIKAGNSIKFINEAAKLAVGGVTDLSSAVKGMTSVMNAYSLSIEDANRVASAFFTAQKFGTTTVQELVQNIGMVAPIAKAAGIGFEEILAAMTLLTVKGLSTDIATTGLRATITALINTTTESEEAFKKMGIQTGITAIRANGLGETLWQVGRAVENNADLLTQFIPNVRALNAVAALATEEGLTMYEKVLEAIKTDTGDVSSLTAALEEQMKTMAKQVEITAGAWKEFRILLAEEAKETGPLQKLKFFMLGVRGSLISMSEAMRDAEEVGEGIGDMFNKILPGVAGFAWEIKQTADEVEKLVKQLTGLEDLTKEQFKAMLSAARISGRDPDEEPLLSDVFFGDMEERKKLSAQIEEENRIAIEATLDAGLKALKRKELIADAELEIELRKQEGKIAITRGAFGLMQGLAGESFLLQKILAISESLISTFLAGQLAYTSQIGIPIIGPILAPAAKRLAIQQGLTNTAIIAGITLAGLKEGGFTGKSKYQLRDKDGPIAGYVHENEYVMTAKETSVLRPMLDDIHYNRIDIHGLAALTRRGVMQTIPKLNADILESEVKKIYRKMSEQQEEKPAFIYSDHGYTKKIGNITINVNT